VRALVDESLKAIAEDGAHAIVFGSLPPSSSPRTWSTSGSVSRA
jgi:hypothetical protein